VPEVLEFLVNQAQMDTRSAYSTLNMGVGFAVYCAAGRGAQVCALAAERGLQAYVAGKVTEGPRRVVLTELGVTLEGTELDLGPRK
jgi:phosphoribosylformylglycinamidine cyclo-ligase